jgi:hypothetical protein
MSRLGPERMSLLSLTVFEVEGIGGIDEIARINSRLLDQYKGQTVRLTAKIIKLDGDTATVEASDGGQVSLSSSFSSSLSSLS